MPDSLTPEELERKWGSCPNGHPVFSRKVHIECLLNGRTSERNYWKWASNRVGLQVWTPERGWL